ncbi:MAG: putative hydroxymethylpyrimidine transporter CytX [Chloroflexota bacterium]
MADVSINPTRPAERTFGGWDFFLLWAGAAISIAEIFTGALLAPLGLGLGLLAIVLGHAIGNTPFALGGIISSQTGVPMMVATRPAFGVRGSYLGAALNVVQLVGWTAVMIVLGGQAANEVSRALFGFDNVLLWKVLVGLVTTTWALVGQRTWKWLNNISVGLLLLLCTLLTYAVLGGQSIGELLARPPSGELPFGVGLDLAIALPISWLPLVGDYSRYARRSSSGFFGSWVGYFVGSCWMFLVGLLAALASGQPNPVPVMLALGLGVPALLVVLLSTFTTAFMDVYSTAVSSLNIAPRLGERPGIVLGGLLGTALALVFPMEQYESFLLLIGATFVPYFGVVLADYFVVHRRHYDTGQMFGRGRYWFWRGLNLRAFVAYALGVLVFRWLAGDDPFGLLGALGLADWVHTNLTVIGASVPAMLFTALVYLLITGRRRSGMAAERLT